DYYCMIWHDNASVF
nr:immunoglobulin light chain junction region [Macaca mulatta]MOX71097.1 immunoglobulin light chain junction region [Macaca mulatta]MOX71187.1 immunoglobulin light chain junction region [Macaca mulatta]MOX71466.1 immunoglobulin light chain junction region [Macaca mulatta]MOX72608.1 immunoglobulin light chain junction region [Macaca mulatta]